MGTVKHIVTHAEYDKLCEQYSIYTMTIPMLTLLAWWNTLWN